MFSGGIGRKHLLDQTMCHSYDTPLCFFFYGLSSSLLSDLNTSKLVPIPRANTQILMLFPMQLLNILQDKCVYVLVLLFILR